ncbi:MFS transporter [Clostridium saccharoperbutylacetonicum]|uniref:MFS transporter n=1 Tax=Clostridium saccharoperbutylacetonicum TaxID=36745 RepID=UPI0039EC9814
MILLFISRFVSFFGDGVYFITINWLIVQMYNSTLALGSVAAISAIPNLMIIPFIGILVDRYARKYLVLSTDLIRGILITILAIMVGLNKFSIIMLYPINIMIGICSSFYAIGYNGLISDIVEKKNLTKFYSVMTMTYQSVYLLGSTLAGFIISQIKITGALTIDIISFIISAICIFSIRMSRKIKINIVEVDIKKSNYLSNIREGIILLRNQKNVMKLIVLGMPITIFISIINIIEPTFVSNVLNGTASDFGFIDAALGIGAVIGAIIVRFITKKNKELVFLYVGYFLVAISLLSFGLSSKVIIAMMLNGIIGITFTITSIIYQSSIQKITDNNIIGRITSVQRFLQNICSPVVIMIVGYLGSIMNYRNLIIGLSLFYMLIFVSTCILLKNRNNEMEVKEL